MPAKPRRVRVGTCPHCSLLTKIDRKSKDDPVGGLTVCRHCYCVFTSKQVATWLEEPASKGGV